MAFDNCTLGNTIIYNIPAIDVHANHFSNNLQQNFEIVKCNKKLKCINGKMETENAKHDCEEGARCRMRRGKPTCVCDKSKGYYKKGDKCVKSKF